MLYLVHGARAGGVASGGLKVPPAEASEGRDSASQTLSSLRARLSTR